MKNVIAIAIVAGYCFAADPGLAGEPAKSSKSSQVVAAAQQAVAGTVGGAVSGRCASTTATSLGTAVCRLDAGQLTGSASGSVKDQVKDQTALLLGNQVNAMVAPVVAGKSGAGQGLGSQVGTQVSQAFGTMISKSIQGGGAGANPAADLRNGLKRTAADALAAPVAKELGARTTGVSALVATRMQQGVQQGLSDEVQNRLGVNGAQSAPGLRDSVRGATNGALNDSVRYELSQGLSGTQQPLVGDLLMLGLNRKLPVDKGTVGGFAPPTDSAVPFDASMLRSGVSVLSDGNGQVGLGVQSEVLVGNKKVKLSGTLDPDLNSKSEKGKSVGLQVTVGGN